ncbi:MAG TPA: hypothetical protein VK867_07025 [Candidatus Limnocylindrales bacterium]|nr:hypothetical protein [Candidatus Limnocylindrales bacterium]
MTHLKAIPFALAALVVTAGAALAFTDLPDQARAALDRASEHADRDLPARPATLPVPADTHAGVAADTQEVAAQDLPEAAHHGAAVSAAAKPADPPADTDHGKDVSDVARDDHGAATAEEHKPAAAGPPEGAGQPEAPGPPESVDIPDAAPEDPGPPTDPGKPASPGRPN